MVDTTNYDLSRFLDLLRDMKITAADLSKSKVNGALNPQFEKVFWDLESAIMVAMSHVEQAIGDPENYVEFEDEPTDDDDGIEWSR